ncbi:orotidine-5'-phosphate decarboxylase [Thalassobacillus hwangdonensis]|uniref:Orotidine 5'-phosphate decarboxylase n=1 Tax=Thalassobacillus hwangdonensis TaxID=546108 RepID=A0ABW3KYF9_9BACI
MKEFRQMYLALDFKTGEEASRFLDDHNLYEVPVKVGMQLFYKEGPGFIKTLRENGHPIFLDLKLHDIPNTVYHAMFSLASLGVEMVNVHAQGGKEMIRAAKQGLMDGSSGGDVPLLIAVTQLTSTDQHMLQHELLVNRSMDETVAHYADLSKEAGADGVVCSVHEVEKVKHHCGNEFLTVTPGIRLKTNENDDQKRVATPLQARIAGTDSIVIGRSVTKAEQPLINYQQIEKEWYNV